MKAICIFIILACFSTVSFAQEKLSNGASLLFKQAKSKLSVKQKNEIFSKTGFFISKDKTQFVIGNTPDEDYPFDAFVYPLDLNSDGEEEICIVFGNSFTSGQAGSSVVLYIADKSGDYQVNLGFPGMVPDALPTKAAGYPDLRIAGPGFEFPVYRWNGKIYDLLRSIGEKEMAKIKMISLEDLSKTYQAGMK